MEGKLRDELLNGEIFYTLKEAQVLIEQWRQEYNTFRPHSSLGYKPPAPETIALDNRKTEITEDKEVLIHSVKGGPVRWGRSVALYLFSSI